MGDPGDFMEAHGHQVITALRAMVQHWMNVRDNGLLDGAARRLAEDQVATWQRLCEEAEEVVQ